MSKDNKQINIYCRECQCPTNHNVIEVRSEISDPEDPVDWGIDHYFCQCAGCNGYCYATAEWTLDEVNPFTGELIYTWKTYPRPEDERHSIDVVRSLPNKVRTIYTEVVGAINAHLPTLTAIGLRTLIEAICKDLGVKTKKRKLLQLIDELASNRILTQEQASILHDHRFLGDVADHEIESAQWTELLAALEIAEAMMKTIYILPGLSKRIITGRDFWYTDY